MKEIFEESPPPYEENAEQLPYEKATSDRNNITTLIESEIERLFNQMVNSALTKAMLVVAPMDTIPGSRDAEFETSLAIEPAPDTAVAIYHLQSTTSSTPFWQLEAPRLKDLEERLRARFCMDKSALRQTACRLGSPRPSTLRSQTVNDARMVQNGYSRRSASTEQVPMFGTSSGWKAEVKQNAIILGGPSLFMGLRDVVLRTRSEMGLFGTRTPQCLIVELCMGG